ncbi:MAG TPA: hydantoinase/oxoprolinase family protein [Gemmatimonadaceae bacterium]
MIERSVGIDVGGTFTDLVSVSSEGSVDSRKQLTTSSDQSEGVLAVLRALGSEPREVTRLVHGTTVATNMLLERNGARVALCATAGASDLLELRRQERASLYDLTRHHPAPLVPPARTIAIDERVTPHGIEKALGAGAIASAVTALRAEAPDVVAISLLHSYRDDSHERALAAGLRAAGIDAQIVCSSDVLPEIREYERTATTVAESYLRPGVARYLSHLGERLEAGGYPALSVMTSSGGMRRAEEAAQSAAALALSGPAGGVSGAAYVARLAGFTNALTIDIGGTSADAGLVLDGAPLIESGGEIAGVPIALPRVLVETVSAGGGSIGWVDDGGALRLGPRSAGATPGPAAFGRGGTEATVTDAQIVLGTLTARTLGVVSLDAASARAAVTRLASSLGVTPERAARAMVQGADAAMARALRRVSVERGVDPRRCVLVAFGGGGPLHACALADHLGARTVLVPPFAGVLSALGLAIAPERRDALASVMRRAHALTAADTRELDALLLARAGARSRDAHAPRDTQRWLRARYLGQGHELEIPFAPGDEGAQLIARFGAEHEKRMGFTLDQEIEVIGARIAVSSAVREPALSAAHPEDESIRGPAVVALADATMFVADGWTARALPIGGYLVERDA